MKTIAKLHVAVIITLMTLALMISSCGGGGGGGATGAGGPDISPDTYTVETTASDSSADKQVTSTSTTSDSTSTTVGTEESTVLEGTLDTSLSGTGGDSTNLDVLISQEETVAASTDTSSTDNSGSSSSDTGTDSSGSTTIADNTSTGNTTDSGTTSSGSTTVADNTNTGSTSDSGTGSSDSTTVADNTGSGSTTDTGNASDSANKNSSGNASDSSSGNNGNKDNAGQSAEDIISEVAPQEESSQQGISYELDSSSGKWYKETGGGEVASDEATSSAEKQAAELRKQIKDIIQQYADKQISHDDAFAKIKSLRAQIAQAISSVGNGGNKIEGIYTNWANQNLYLDIKNGAPGWYRLIVIAKNRGTLPDSYDRFSFDVTNESGDIIGSFKVKASDKVYYRGSIDFNLEKAANTRLNLLWTNDYYIEGQYDANVNIKKVILKKINEPKKKHLFKERHLQGDQYSEMDGRWFFEEQSAYTFWSGQEISYTFKNMEEGQYEITIEAQNYGSLPLPKNYKEFQVDIESDYDSATMAIPASDKKWEKETITMSFPEGSTTLRLVWTNDSYKEGEYDTNIKIKSISAKKVKESNLTAYLLKTKPGNKIFILAAFLIISGVLTGIYIKNRSTSSES